MHNCKLLASTLYAWAIPFEELTENLYLQGRIDDVYVKYLALAPAANAKTGPP